LLAQYDPTTPRTEEDRAWIDMVPVGREFDSAEFDELERQAEAEAQGCATAKDPSMTDLADAAERERLKASAIR
jgi:hypothetical protein